MTPPMDMLTQKRENSQGASILENELQANGGKLRGEKKWLFSGKNPLPTQLVIQYQVVNSEIIYIVSIIQTEHVLSIYYVMHTTKQRKRGHAFES